MIAGEGQPFDDPEADAAMFGRDQGNDPPTVDLVEMDCDINDPAFADAWPITFDGHMRSQR